jgi:tetratricopeptide (TPR) repeat protein
MMRPLLFVGYGSVGAGLVLRWTNASISRGFAAFSYPLSGDLNHVPHFLLFSYGCLIVVLLLLSPMAVWKKSPALFYVVSAGLFGLSLYAPIQMAYGQPERLRTLLVEHDQYRKIVSFTGADLPINRGVEPTFEPSVNLTTVWNRFQAAEYFMSEGWDLLLAGTFLIFLIALRQFKDRTRLEICLCTLSIYAGILVWSVCGPLAGEYEVRRALIDDLEGRVEMAVLRYQLALKWDRWYRLRPSVFVQIGELHAKSGRTDTAEYHLYRGTVEEASQHMSEAIYENETAGTMSGQLREIGRREAARVAAEYAVALYAEDAVGGAMTNWQTALQNDPRQFYALFCLCRAYHELAAYPKSIEIGRELLKLCSNSLILANVHSNLADDFEKLGNFPEARFHYAISEKLDDDRNFRAYNGLTGH